MDANKFMTEKKILDHLSDTEVFETYWRFASERHAILERRLRGEPPPWTEDPIYRSTSLLTLFGRRTGSASISSAT